MTFVSGAVLTWAICAVRDNLGQRASAARSVQCGQLEPEWSLMEQAVGLNGLLDAGRGT
jgi:hypothetical protein